MWHSTACHNVSGKLRVAGQNRWVASSRGGGPVNCAAPPSTFSRCFNRGGEGMPAK